MPSLYIPSTLDELLALLNAGAVRPVAGGTDWIVKHGRALAGDARVADLSAVRELKGIAAETGELVVGAMETMSAVAGNEILRRHAACLAKAAASVGSWQIRNRATLGGNLANSSPAADTPVALAALDAVAEVRSSREVRRLTVPEILAARPNTTTLKPNEIVAAFRIPLKTGRISAFGKIGSRSEVSIARLNLAVSAIVDRGALTDARVFVGTLGCAALRCPEAEQALLSHPTQNNPAQSGDERAEAFCSALAAAVERAIPGRATLPYKRSAIRALSGDVLAELIEQGKEVKS